MAEFEVWAPRPSYVELQLGERRLPMEPAAEGWWRVTVPDAGPGADYAFVLDGGAPLPDPRSRFQPQGVHGPSRLIDPSSFHWTDRTWQPPPLSAAVIYELHVGAFTPQGTFDATIERLDYLIDLGITHVELMPIAEFPGRRGWGYDGVDLYAPHHAYGGPAGLNRLVNACHEKGLAILLDVVYNHLGPEGNYLSQFGPYFSERIHTAWGAAVNLDEPGSDHVRRYFIDNALMWLRDYHMDGLRLDAVHALTDTSAINFMEQLAHEVDLLQAGLGRHMVVIAESDLNDPRLVRPIEMGGYGMDAAWSDDFHHALHTLLTGEHGGYYADFGEMSDLAKALTQVYVFNGAYSPFRRRRHGRPVIGLPGYKFIGYLQNHDQVGNRATGDRLSQTLSLGQLKIGAALVLTSPFVPMLFMGEEWGASTPFQYFVSMEDQQLNDAIREGRRGEFAHFGWDPAEVPDPTDPATFQRSTLDWAERSQPPHNDLLAWYRQLIHLRHHYPSLTDGQLAEVRVNYDARANWLTVQRGPVLLACNFASQPQRLDRKGLAIQEILLTSEAGVQLQEDCVLLPPESAVLFK